MNLAAIEHRPQKEYLYPAEGNAVVCSLRAAREDLQECRVCFRRETDRVFAVQTMECVLRDRNRDFYSARLQFPDLPRYFSYYFEMTGKDGTRARMDADGFRTDGSEGRCFRFLWANRSDGYRIPEWCRGRIYYQIFPERFCNGDASNDPAGTERWGSEPTRRNFMGGDLQGILSRLDYLEGLGINALYLTPVFLSPSNHKYDTEDYGHVDPAFGTTDDLKRLVGECHSRNMKVVLDGVFNHCGDQFRPFRDALENGRQSPYWDWFFFSDARNAESVPEYRCFGDYERMPKWNHDNPEVRRYLTDAAKYWVREAKIDGWRLDVADEVQTDFWESFRRELREENEDVFLMGETWGDASRLVYGNRLDSAMNYLFRDCLVDWIARRTVDADVFDDRINRMLSLYSKETFSVLYNLLDSHDTPRFLYECGGDTRRMKLAVGFQMTFPGCPAIFYGDEAGLSGPNDPGCRMAMVWEPEKRNVGIEQWYRKMIAVRKALSPLTEGDYRTVLCDAERNLFGFRRHGEGSVYVVLNNSGEEQTVSVPVCEPGVLFRDVVSGGVLHADRIGNPRAYRNGDILRYVSTVALDLPPFSIRILCAG